MEQEAEQNSPDDGWNKVPDSPWPVDDPTAYKEESQDSWTDSNKPIFEYERDHEENEKWIANEHEEIKYEHDWVPVWYEGSPTGPLIRDRAHRMVSELLDVQETLFVTRMAAVNRMGASGKAQDKFILAKLQQLAWRHRKLAQWMNDLRDMLYDVKNEKQR